VCVLCRVCVSVWVCGCIKERESVCHVEYVWVCGCVLERERERERERESGTHEMGGVLVEAP